MKLPSPSRANMVRGVSLLGLIAVASVGYSNLGGDVEPEEMRSKTDAEIEALMDPLVVEIASTKSRRALSDYRASKGLFSCEGDCPEKRQLWLEAKDELDRALLTRAEARRAARIRERQAGRGVQARTSATQKTISTRQNRAAINAGARAAARKAQREAEKRARQEAARARIAANNPGADDPQTQADKAAVAEACENRPTLVEAGNARLPMTDEEKMQAWSGTKGWSGYQLWDDAPWLNWQETFYSNIAETFHRMNEPFNCGEFCWGQIWTYDAEMAEYTNHWHSYEADTQGPLSCSWCTDEQKALSAATSQGLGEAWMKRCKTVGEFKALQERRNNGEPVQNQMDIARMWMNQARSEYTAAVDAAKPICQDTCDY